MSQTSGLGISSALFVAQASSPTLHEKSIRERFSLINDFHKTAKARVSLDSPDSLQSFNQEILGKLTDAMRNLSSSIRYSDTNVLDSQKIIVSTVRNIAADDALLKQIIYMAAHEEEERLAVLNKVEAFHKASARDVTKIDFMNTEVTPYFFAREKATPLQPFTLGQFFSKIDDPITYKRVLGVNRYCDAEPTSPITGPAITVHESAHDLQAYKAWILKCRQGISPLGDYHKPDAEIDLKRMEAKATISYEFYDAYMAQHHEVDAHRQHGLFATGLMEIIANRNMPFIRPSHFGDSAPRSAI
jgi:hypothetical protein